MATNKDILGVLKTLGEVYGQEPEAEQIKGYVWALEDYEPDALEAAAKDAVRFCKWFPKPSELREIAERKRRDAVAAQEDDTEARMYWRSMDLFGALLRGEITDQQFSRDKSVTRQNLRNGLFDDWEFEELVIESKA
jgi:hypothetical protein